MFLTAANYLTSGTSAPPLGERGSRKEYKIDAVIADWMRDVRIQGRLKFLCNRERGWEGWAQLEFETVFKDAFPITTDVREQSEVFNDQQTADFVLPRTDEFTGMIIELVCENQSAQKGNAMRTLVDRNIKKKYNVTPEYKDHTFVVLAMAFTTEAQEALTEIGMSPIPQAESSVDQGALRVYKETFSLSELTDTTEDLNQASRGLLSYGYGPESDKAKKTAGSA